MPIFATHFVGGDFQICQTGPNTFEVTLRVYRDCLPGNSTTIRQSSVIVRDNVTGDQITSFSITSNLISQTVLAITSYSTSVILVWTRNIMRSRRL